MRRRFKNLGVNDTFSPPVLARPFQAIKVFDEIRYFRDEAVPATELRCRSRSHSNAIAVSDNRPKQLR